MTTKSTLTSDRIRERANKSTSQAIGIPSAAYTAEDALALERQTIFFDRWCAIASTSEVPVAGDVKSLIFAGAPLILVRDTDENIRVHHNICPHRGTQLVDGEQNCSKIVCPYHAWSFNLNGRLSRAPHYPGASVEDFSLNTVRSHVWCNTVFINLSGHAPAFEETVSPLLERWSDYDLSHLVHGETLVYDFKANWKLICENFLEAYHVPSVHPNLAGYSKPGDRYQVFFGEEFIGQGSSTYAPVPVERELPRWPGIKGDREFEAEYVALFPNTLIGRMPDHVFVWHLIPVTPEHTIEVLNFYFITENAMADCYTADRDATLRRWQDVNDEDSSVIHKIHQGMRSPFFEGARFAPGYEETVLAFQKLYVNSINAVGSENA